MKDYQKAYDILVEQLEHQGINIQAVKEALKKQHIETPSWGYANSGTRFKAFAWNGAAVTTRQKIEASSWILSKIPVRVRSG